MNQQRIISIHQPNFFPWLGFFDKIARSDIFIYLDHVATNDKQVYFKRVKLLISGTDRWLSVPVKHATVKAETPLTAWEIDAPIEVARKHLITIERNYKKSLFFLEIFPIIEQFYSANTSYLLDRNINFIESVCQGLNLTTPRIKSSTLNCTQHSTDLLIEITQKLNASCYLCGSGATGYQDDRKFTAAGILVSYQNYTHPVYTQKNAGSFIPGLSIIDVLMNCGWTHTQSLLLQNAKTDLPSM